MYYVVIMSYYYNQPYWTTGQGQANTKMATNIKMGQANGKLAYQIENWHKRSFYQGPGVKFPILWEKITLPPGLLWLFCMLKTTPLKPDFCNL